MNHPVSKRLRLPAPEENAWSLPRHAKRPPAAEPAAPKKTMTMADFMQSGMSARKRAYLEALQKSISDQEGLIVRATQLRKKSGSGM